MSEAAILKRARLAGVGQEDVATTLHDNPHALRQQIRMGVLVIALPVDDPKVCEVDVLTLSQLQLPAAEASVEKGNSGATVIVLTPLDERR